MRTVLPTRLLSRAALAIYAVALVACGGRSVSDSTSDTSPDAGPFPYPAPSSSFLPCVAPVPVIIAGQDTGYDTCQGGVLRRRAVFACPSLVPRAAPCAGTPAASSLEQSCAQDSDCTTSPNGVCGSPASAGSSSTCFCSYGCTTDAECGTGSICVCGDPVGTCEPASCTSGASCANGAACAEYDQNPSLGCGTLGFACETAGDTCLSDEDCPASAAGDNIPSSMCGMLYGARACVAGLCAP